MRLAWFWNLEIFPKIAKKTKSWQLKPRECSILLLVLKKKTKTCDKNVYFFVCFKNANNYNFVCFLFLKTLMKMTVWEIVFPQKARSCKIHCFEKHIFPIINVWKQLSKTSKHFIQLCPNLSYLAFLLLMFENQQLQWKLKTMSCCNYRFFIKTKPTIQNSTQKTTPKTWKKNFVSHSFFRECVH